MKVLVSGSSGLIGSALLPRLTAAGHKVVRMVRSDPQEGDVSWNARTGVVADAGLEGFDAVIHLAGVSIGEKRWSESEKERIWDSRVATAEVLAKQLQDVVAQPSVFICASAVGYYGSQGDTVLTEDSPQGEGFLPSLCENWEQAAQIASSAGIRVVNLRSGIVLDPGGGALGRQLPLFRGGLGGRLGDGTQYLSWIALQDEVEAILHILNTPTLSGPVNLCSPHPVTNAEFTQALGNAVHRPTIIPIWPWLLHIAVGRELTNEMLLASQRAVPEKLVASGFAFKFPELEQALDTMLRRNSNIRRRPVQANDPSDTDDQPPAQ